MPLQLGEAGTVVFKVPCSLPPARNLPVTFALSTTLPLMADFSVTFPLNLPWLILAALKV